MWQQKPNRNPRLILKLKEDVDNLGVEGQIVAVKHGYGRNFLVPRNKAGYIPPMSRATFAKLSQKESGVFLMKKSLESKTITTSKDSSSDWAIFEQHIAELLRHQVHLHVPIDRVLMDDCISSYGEHQFAIALDDGSTVEMKLSVAESSEEEGSLEEKSS